MVADRPVTLAPPITLAVVAGAHGVTGEVRLKLFGEGVGTLKRHRAFNANGTGTGTGTGTGGSLTVSSLRDDAKGGAIARFAEVTTRNAAEALRGTALTVPRSSLPPLADGEYYHADLLGLACVSTSGEVLGTCIAIDNFGAGDVLEIERPDAKRFMVPMRADAVPEWDETRLVIEDLFAAE